MKTKHTMPSALAVVVALVVVVLSLSPAPVQAGEKKRHSYLGHQSSYAYSEEHGYARRRHIRDGYREYVVPTHVVRHEVVYETHRPLHYEATHARPYLSLNIRLPLAHIGIW